MVGGPETVKKGVADFIARYRPDEIIATAQIFDYAARLKSFEILSEQLPASPRARERA